MAKYAYTEEGKAAIVVLATMMIKADGRTDPKEIDLSLIFYIIFFSSTSSKSMCMCVTFLC